MGKKGGARLVLATSAIALSSAAQAGEAIAYSYDALGRLVATTNTGSFNNGVNTSLGYDAAGNRLCYKVGGAAVPCPPPPPPPNPPPAPPAPGPLS